MLATVETSGDYTCPTFVYWHLVEMQDDLHKAERAYANNT
jgi:hypothetical protein